MDEEGPLRSEFHRHGAVHQLARIRPAHLEEHAKFEFFEGAPLERALEVGERIAPDEQVNPDRRSVLEQGDEVLGGCGLLLTAKGRIPEVALVASQLAKAGQIADDHVDCLAVEHLLVNPSPHLVGELLDRIAHAEPADHLGLVRKRWDEVREQEVGFFFGDRRLKNNKACRPAEAAARMRVVRGRKADHRHRQETHSQVFPLTDDQQVGSALATENCRRRILDGDRVAQPRQRRRSCLLRHRA